MAFLLCVSYGFDVSDRAFLRIPAKCKSLYWIFLAKLLDMPPKNSTNARCKLLAAARAKICGRKSGDQRSCKDGCSYSVALSRLHWTMRIFSKMQKSNRLIRGNLNLWKMCVTSKEVLIKYGSVDMKKKRRDCEQTCRATCVHRSTSAFGGEPLFCHKTLFNVKKTLMPFFNQRYSPPSTRFWQRQSSIWSEQLHGVCSCDGRFPHFPGENQDGDPMDIPGMHQKMFHWQEKIVTSEFSTILYYYYYYFTCMQTFLKPSISSADCNNRHLLAHRSKCVFQAMNSVFFSSFFFLLCTWIAVFKSNLFTTAFIQYLLKCVFLFFSCLKLKWWRAHWSCRTSHIADTCESYSCPLWRRETCHWPWELLF